MFDRRFILFLLCNGFAAAVNFASRFAFSLFVSYAVAVVFAYCCGMITAFVLSRSFVFTGSEGRLGGQAWRFILVNVLAVTQTCLFSVGLAEFIFPWTGMRFYPEALAHAIGVAAPVFTSYLGHRHFTFREH